MLRSISLNFDYGAAVHRDGNNAGPSLARALGDFMLSPAITCEPESPAKAFLNFFQMTAVNLIKIRSET